MSEIVDELLKEVQELESATDTLETSSDKMQQQQQDYDNAKAGAAMEPDLIALETAKTAQEAAKQSQLAAQASIRQTENLKSEILEITESNFNWRQAVRHANQEFKAAKSTFSIMMITAILFSSIALAAAGYFMYSMKKQNEQLKGEIIDLLANENALLKKSINLKMDEMASVIENLNHPANVAANHLKTAEHNQTIDIASEAIPELSAMHNQTGEAENTVTQTATQTETNPATNQVDKQSLMADESANQTTNKPNDKPAMNPAAMSADEKEQLMSQLSWLKENSMTKEDLVSIKAELDKLNTQVQALKTVKSASGLSAEQTKKLDGVHWLVRQQTKQIEELAKELKAVTTPKPDEKSATQTMSEFNAIKAQQAAMADQLKQIQKTIDELSELSKEPPPYSYKAR